MRLSKSGVEIGEANFPTVLLVNTKAPNKYLLIDRETGQVYQGKNPGGIDKDLSWLYIHTLDNKQIEDLENKVIDTSQYY